MTADALIYDDDPFFLGYLQVILTDLGLSVRSFTDAHDAMAQLRRESPKIMFLDTMVPGAEGLSLCKEIKTDPVLSKIKVVIVSAKVYVDDKARASWAKADLYINKPFDTEEVYAQIQDLIPGLDKPAIRALKADEHSPESGQEKAVRAKPSASSPEDKAREALERPWKLRFWGKGGDCDCVSLIDRGRLLVFDAGAGLETLAQQSVPDDVKEVWLLLSHFHRDHVAGLAHARRWIEAGRTLNIVGPAESESLLARLVQRVLPFPSIGVFPVWAGDFDGIAGLRVSQLYTMHPGPCFAYRVETPARSVVFASDSEIPPTQNRNGADNLERLAAFALGADVLLHDARYSDQDYARFQGRGHGSPSAALDVALRASARSLVLYHVDARYGPAEREYMLAQLRSYSEADMKLETCLLAHNGLEIDL